MDKEAGPIIVWSVISLIVGLFVGSWLSESQYRAEATERGYAQYCPDTGYWKWKGECDE